MTPSGLELMQAAFVGPSDPDILACEAHIRAAQLTADVAALDLLIADELLFTGPDGQLGTKAQDLAREVPAEYRKCLKSVYLF
jgi:hypothetical protein